MILQSHQKLEALRGFKAEGLQILELGLDRVEAHLNKIDAPAEVFDRAFEVSLQFIRNRSKSNMGWCRYTWDSKDHATAKCTSSKITINWGSTVFAKSPGQIHDTILHELAHHLCVVLHGPAGANHGPLWREAAEICGADPRATYDEFKTRKRRA